MGSNFLAYLLVFIALGGSAGAELASSLSRTELAARARENFAEAIRLACRDIYMEGVQQDTATAKRNLCHCWQNGITPSLFRGRDYDYWRSRVIRACSTGGDLDRWGNHLVGVLATEKLEGFNRACIDMLREQQRGTFYYHLSERCETAPLETLDQALFYPGAMAQGQSCWRMTNLTPDGCLIADSCTQGGSYLGSLGITGEDAGKLRRTATLCNANLTKTHAMKDPLRLNQDLQRPLPQAHLPSAAFVHGGGDYAQPNCHGTAAYLAGGLFDDVEVPSKIAYPGAYEKECRPFAEAAFEKGKRGEKAPTVGSLNLSDSFGINLKYEGCGPEDCGEASMNVLWCHGGKLRSYVLIHGMCLSCWDRKLQAKGYTKLGPTQKWQHLYPGCILTTNDHTATIMLVSSGMCYSYEVIGAGAQPQLRIEACASLYARLPHRWCPREPMRFQLRQ